MQQQYRSENPSNFMRSELPLPPVPYGNYGGQQNPNESRFQSPFPSTHCPPPPFVGYPPSVQPPANIMPFMMTSQPNTLPTVTGFPPPTHVHPTTKIPHQMTAPSPPVGFLPPTNIPPPPFPPAFNINSSPQSLPPVTPVGTLPPPTIPVLPMMLNSNSVPIATPNLSIPPPQISVTVNIASFPPPPVPPAKGNPSRVEAKTCSPLEETDVKSVDNHWVEKWLQQRTLKKKTSKQENGEMTVCIARQVLRNALQTLSDLRMATGFLKNSVHVDDEMWHFKLRKAEKLKEKLNALLSQFNSETVTSLKKRLKKIQAKRSRIKRQHLTDQKNSQLEVENRQRAHALIDAWRKDIEDKSLNEKRKEELKSEADNILSEVRKKLQEARKVLDHLDVLERLRSARLESSEKKGLKVSSGSTERFEETVMKLRKLMTHQLSVYETEERALKAMLETEREQEKQDKVQEKLEMFNAFRDETLLRLFGTPPDPSSHLYFYWQYYVQGHTNLETLAQIRHQWDMYLTPQDDPDGSAVPLGVVLPRPPSSKTWQCFLENYEPS